MKFFKYKTKNKTILEKLDRLKGEKKYRGYLLEIIRNLENFTVNKNESEIDFCISTSIDSKDFEILERSAKRNGISKTQLITEYIKKAV